MGAEMDRVITSFVMTERPMASVALRRRYLIALQSIGAADRTETIEVFRRFSAVRAAQTRSRKVGNQSGEHEHHTRRPKPDRPFVRNQKCRSSQDHAAGDDFDKQPDSPPVSVCLRLKLMPAWRVR